MNDCKKWFILGILYLGHVLLVAKRLERLVCEVDQPHEELHGVLLLPEVDGLALHNAEVLP